MINRKLLVTVSLLIILCMPSALSAEETAKVLTLRDAINTAFINNLSIQIQEREIEFARADIVYARSVFFPTATVGYDYTHNDAVPNYGAGLAPREEKKDAGIFTGYNNDNMLNLGAHQIIFNGGANISTYRQAELNLKAQEETLRAGKLEVEFETKRLFYGLLLGYETLRIAQNLVDQAQAHYEETKAMYDQGTASKFDVLQSKTYVSTLIPQLVSAQNAIDLLMTELKKQIGMNMSTLIKVSGDLNKYSLVDINETAFLQESYRSNPQIKLKLLGVDINRWAITFAKAGWYPQVEGTGNYYFRSNNPETMFDSNHRNWNLGVKASINIFDGFATKAKVDEAKVRYRQAELSKQDVMDQVVVDVKNACVNMKRSKAIIDSQKDSIVEATEALRLANVRFENGVGINLDVMDAQVSLAQIEQSLAQGIYDYLMAKSALNRTMGRQFYLED